MKSRYQKRDEAALRNVAYAKLTLKEKLARAIGKRERARLEKLIAKEQK